MIELYLSKLSNSKKKEYLDKCRNDIIFSNFLLNCYKLNICIFNDNEDILSNKLITDKLEKLKILYLKKHGMEIYEKYSRNTKNAIKLIKENTIKLEKNFNIIDDILNYCNKKNNFGINYSEKYEYIKFDDSLFVISDENFNDEIVEKISSEQKSPYIAEYSN
jgi:hypothetical protein